MAQSVHRFFRLLCVLAVSALVLVVVPVWLSAADVTFSRDVAPIFQQKCQSCHVAGGVAPMPLVTYEQARAAAQKIKQRVAAREMPP